MKFLSSRRLIVAICLVIFIVSGWFLYIPFIEGKIPGIYPFAAFYSTLGILISLLLFLSPIMILAALFYAIAPLFTRQYSKAQKIDRMVFPLSILVFLPLAILAFYPAIQTFDHGSSLTVKSWKKTYHTAYSSSMIQDRYGEGLIFQCDKQGIFCHRVHGFPGYTNILDDLRLKYDQDKDRFMVEHSRIENSNILVYVRSKWGKLGESTPPIYQTVLLFM